MRGRRTAQERDRFVMMLLAVFFGVAFLSEGLRLVQSLWPWMLGI